MKRENDESDVFISYRRVCPDQEWVQKDLFDALKKAGLRVWLDRWSREPGARIPAQTQTALRQSRRAVCVISPAYVKELRKRSGWLTREFEMIFDSNQSENLRLIPLLLGGEKIPERIESLVAINLANPAIHKQEWEKLLNALEAKNPGAPAPRALRFYFVKLYLCPIISFFWSYPGLVIAGACLALVFGVAAGMGLWPPASGGNHQPEMQTSPVGLVEGINIPRPAPDLVVKTSPTPTAEPTTETLPQAKIKITQNPPAGGSPKKWVTISGRVTGADLGGLRVVIYSYADEKWYVQPLDTAPFTSIDFEGRWAARIHPGITYAALLVKDGFTPPAIIRNSPESLGGGIVDFQIVQAGSSLTAR